MLEFGGRKLDVVKPHLFLGCSSEKLPVAESLRDRLRSHARVRLWTKGVFRLSSSVLESLEEVLPEFDAAVFVLAPDDVARIRENQVDVVRDNVIFELGFFIGALGRHRTFFVVPRKDLDRLHLPTDLAGATYAPYDVPRRRADWPEAIRPAAEAIRDALRDLKGSHRRRQGLLVDRIEFFEDVSPDFDRMFAGAKRITTFFIHSRRWREDYTSRLREFLARPATMLTAILPEPNDSLLREMFLRNFADGPQIPVLMEDACCFYAELDREFPGKVSVLFAKTYPTYSLYRFDDRAIVAMYPTTARKKSVPTFIVRRGSGFGDFVDDDVTRLIESSRPPTKTEWARFRKRGLNK
jgi:hypothetical protein